MSVFFISDVHLGENYPEREAQKLARLNAFLDLVAKQGSELYIVGDLFEIVPALIKALKNQNAAELQVKRQT